MERRLIEVLAQLFNVLHSFTGIITPEKTAYALSKVRKSTPVEKYFNKNILIYIQLSAFELVIDIFTTCLVRWYLSKLL